MAKVLQMREMTYANPIDRTRTSGFRSAMAPLPRAITATLAVMAMALAMMLSVLASPAFAQNVERVDPDDIYTGSSGAIDADLADPAARDLPPAPQSAPTPVPVPQSDRPSVVPPRDAENTAVAPTQSDFDEGFAQYSDAQSADGQAGDPAAPDAPADPANAVTYGQDDLIGAAEGVFGKGAEGLAGLIQDLLAKQGEPNGYIVGREGGGAFIFGVRYGSGTLHHKIEGQRRVYWTGPSVGFDAGANAGSTFVLVYNLFDSEDLYRRFPAGEGQAYFVGGLHVSYVRRGDIVLIPIRMGAGLRLGVNAGYMRFSKKQRWLPF